MPTSETDSGPLAFAARVLLRDGSAVEDRVIMAPSSESAVAQVNSTGDRVVSIRPAGRSARRASARTINTSVWCREVLSLLTAGMTIVEALDAITISNPADHTTRNVFEQLQRGQSLSSAMEQSGAFPRLLVASVRASERTSDLPHAVQSYLEFDEMLSSLRRKVTGAAVYPALVLMVGGGVTLFLLTFVVPRFSVLYSGDEISLSWPSRLLMALSSGLAAYPWASAAVFVGSAALGLLWIRSGHALAFARRIALRWPWIRTQIRQFELARLYEAMAMLMRGGYAVPEALELCIDLGDEESFKQTIKNAQAHVKRGGTLTAAMTGAHLTDAVTQRLLAAGEGGGGMEKVLKSIAFRHRQSFELFIDRLTRLAEPILTLLVAMVVGAVVVLLYLPIFDIAGSIG